MPKDQKKKSKTISGEKTLARIILDLNELMASQEAADNAEAGDVLLDSKKWSELVERAEIEANQR